MNRILMIFLFISIVTVNAQTKRPTWKLVYSDSKVEVSIRFYITNNICYTSTKTNTFEYKISGTPYSYQKYYKWNLIYKDCNGNIITEPQRVLIGGSNAMTGIKRSTDYSFRGTLINSNDNTIIDKYLADIRKDILNNNFSSARNNLEKIITLKSGNRTTNTTTNNNVVKIGQHTYGGIVFYVDNTGKHGLVSAEKDEGEAEWEEAKSMCKNLTLNGYSDWYLPSKDKLNKLYKQKEIVGGFSNSGYWSSSEYNSNNAWRQYFDDGYQLSGSKNYNYYLRCVRSF